MGNRRRLLLTRKKEKNSYFLLVFFAFALFFLAWSARTVRGKQRPIILPLSGCRLLSNCRQSGQKWGDTVLGEGLKSPNPTAKNSVIMYCIVLCLMIQITAMHLSDCQEDTYLSIYWKLSNIIKLSTRATVLLKDTLPTTLRWFQTLSR